MTTSKKTIRGPYPPGIPDSGFQDYYVGGALSESPKVTVHFTEQVLDRAVCSCTQLASLQNQCSHIQFVLAFREQVSSGKATSPSVKTNHLAGHTSGKVQVSPSQQSPSLPTTISSFKQIAPSVLCAIRDEIAAIQTSTNVKRVTLVHGLLVGKLAGNFKYKFDLEDDDFRSPPDVPIELTVGGDKQVFTGTISSCEPGQFIEIALSEFIGDPVPEAILESRLDFIWQRAAKRIESYQQADPRGGMIDEVLNTSCEVVFDASLEEDWDEYPPDDDQRSALQRALQRRVTFVHGPPGTGKSVTIGWLVKELVRRGERVIVTSHTNIAVDNALEKAIKLKAVNEAMSEGRVIRLGEPKEDLKQLRLSEVIQRMSAGLQQELADLRERHRQVASELCTAEEEIRILQGHRSVLAEYSSSKQQASSVDSRIEHLEIDKRGAEGRLDKLERQRVVFSLTDLFLYLPRVYQRREAQTQVSEIESKLQKVRGEKSKILQRMVQASQKLHDATLPLEPSEFEARLSNATTDKEQRSSDVAEVEKRIQELQGQIDKIGENVLANIQVLGATLSKICIENALENLNCDTLIIDELSTAPFPFVLVALGLPTKRVVFFGDPMQLPPISTSQSTPEMRTPATKQWLEKDTYEIVSRPKDVETRLLVQRRMPCSVVKLVNRRMYDGELKNDDNPKTQEKRTRAEADPPFSGASVIFVDTSSLNPWSSYDSNGSRYNIYSAEVVTEIIAQEIRSQIKKAIGGVGVICPYRAQKRLIKKLCESKFPAKTEDNKYKFAGFINFHTVDAFQGEERDIVILDLTAGPPGGPGIRLSEVREKQLNQGRNPSKVSRLLNVAVTRTKKKLIIVANKTYFERELTDEHEFVRELIKQANTIEEGYCSVDGEPFLQSDTIDPNQSSCFLNERSYFTSLRKDLANSKSSAVIISPFVTRNRVEDLKPSITSMLKRGIKVTIVTRPLNVMSFGVEAVKQLESWGCNVRYRPKTHEKIVFVDNRIAYYGSLNTLSHLDTKETMFRFEGEEVISLLGQFVGVVAPIARPLSAIRTTQGLIQQLTREECASKLRYMRYKIGTQRHIPFYAPLYNQTIEYLLDNPPTNEEELYEALKICGEKQMKHIAPFLDEILSILRRYRP